MNRASYANAKGRRAGLAVAGLGRMGVVHAQNLASRCPSAQLLAVFDPRPDVAKQVSAQLGATAVATYDELLSDPSLDGVVIASSTNAHAELALSAAQAGKHVFCEKPLSLERNVTVEVVEALEGAGVKLQVGFHRRFDPAFSAAAERVEAGELGEVYLFRAAQRDMAPPRPEFLAGSGGIFIDMGIHDFDAARCLVGEVDSVSAQGAALSDPGFAEIGDFDTAIVVLTFASGALGVVDISRVAGYGYDSSTELVGSQATVRIDEPFFAWLRMAHSRYRQPSSGDHFRPPLCRRLCGGTRALCPFDRRRHPAVSHRPRRTGGVRLGVGGRAVVPAGPGGKHEGGRPGSFRRWRRSY